VTRPLIHPRMTARLTPTFYPDHVAVQVTTGGKDAAGGVTDSWGTVTALQSLPCRISPTGGQQERQAAYGTITDATHAVLIPGDYEGAITTKHRLLAASGAIYDVLAVAADSAHATTRVLVRQVST
jgi:head-tail joining protein